MSITDCVVITFIIIFIILPVLIYKYWVKGGRAKELFGDMGVEVAKGLVIFLPLFAVILSIYFTVVRQNILLILGFVGCIFLLNWLYKEGILAGRAKEAAGTTGIIFVRIIIFVGFIVTALLGFLLKNVVNYFF